MTTNANTEPTETAGITLEMLRDHPELLDLIEDEDEGPSAAWEARWKS